MIGITDRSALIVVDMQRDFCEGGALPVKGCSSLVPVINSYIDIFRGLGRLVIASRDWHPPNHSSFKEFGGPWPPHCVQGSEGAEFHPELRLPPDAVIISKADTPEKEAYSAFDNTELHYILTKAGVRRVFVCGVATDYCVKHTAKDALELGYEVVILRDAVAAVDPAEGEKVLRELVKAGAVVASSGDILK
ncbi:MAG: nicotinamidase [Thermoprotei archaeon]|nr:MAG: nicotinamidase [Thermoprotei archaeon]